jgi:hypothetical protein
MMKNDSSILITGDFCPVNRTGELFRENKAVSLLNDFQHIVNKAGLAITNLECPLTQFGTGINKIGPLMRAPESTAKVLLEWGFGVVTLANNHIMDFGQEGLASTIKACTDSGIEHVGAGLEYNDARKILYIKVGKYIWAVLNFSENEFSTTSGKDPGANPLDPIENYRDIVAAKSASDYVLVIVHGGHEMYNLPSPRIKNTLHFYAEAGASAVIQHHAHCYSGYEIYKGVPIFYGLGNFVFDIPSKSNSIWNYGYAVELTPGSELLYRIIPYEQSNGQPGVKLLNENQREGFLANLKALNIIIDDDCQLNQQFENHCRNVGKMYRAFLEPHSVNVLHSLRHRRLFPSLLGRRKRTLYLNLFRCESHREIVIKLLNDSL